jgi:MarR family transcriptional regulator, 2-MHQ and catechol-resistance regulon repressor
MGIEKDIGQVRFRNAYHRSYVNLFYTYGWLMEKIKQILATENITPQQYNILRILRGSYPNPLATLQIRDRMLDKMSDTSRIVDRLVLKKLVTKSINRNDKRQVNVYITDTGLALLQRLDEKNSTLDSIVSTLSHEEADELNRLLDKIREDKNQG